MLVTTIFPFAIMFLKGFFPRVVKKSELCSKELTEGLSPLELENFVYEPFPKRQILVSSKLKEFADDNFKFDENERKLSKRVENTVGKGEIARYEQFLLFPQCFQKACFPGASKGVIVWEWVKDRNAHCV